MILLDLDGRRVVRFHDDLLAAPRAAIDPEKPRHAEGLWHWLERNHVANLSLWDEEDQARRTDVPDAEIVRCKRSIDRWNQRRNDAVEAVDLCLLEALAADPPDRHARLHSETPGAMIDRLSILSLKIHHMGHEAKRADAGESHRRTCAEKLERLVVQRNDLRDCLDRLLGELVRGESRFRLYRQFKMYNDPALNPWLYRRAEAARAESAMAEPERTEESAMTGTVQDRHDARAANP